MLKVLNSKTWWLYDPEVKPHLLHTRCAYVVGLYEDTKVQDKLSLAILLSAKASPLIHSRLLCATTTVHYNKPVTDRIQNKLCLINI